MVEPLPCPFCGEKSITIREGSTFRWMLAECLACGATCGEVRVQTLDSKAAIGETQGAFEDVLQGEYTVATDDGAPGDDAGVDTTTGEIIGGASDQADHPGDVARNALTADQVRERLARAGDVDLLDADADLIREIADPEQQAELTALYRERRDVLTGGAAPATQQQAPAARRPRSGVSMD